MELRIPRPRGSPFTFTFDGREVEAYPGETIAAALWASGIKLLGRSLRYHRPRGAFCFEGVCATCLVRVDGRPGVRSCLTRAKPGMVVRSENSYPSARYDVFSLLDRLFPRYFDHHRSWSRIPGARPILHRIARRLSGRSKLPSQPERPCDVRKERVDILVVGGGAAGLSASIEAAGEGGRVVLLEEGEVGGHLRTYPAPVLGTEGPTFSKQAEERARKAGVEVIPSSAFGWYPEEKVLGVVGEGGVTILSPKVLVLCPGTYPLPPLFPGNDLPGIVSARGALRLLFERGILPEGPVFIQGRTEDGVLSALVLQKAGVEVTIVEEPGFPPPPLDLSLPESIERWEKTRIVRAEGGKSLERLWVEKEGEIYPIPARTLLCARGRVPRVELCTQTGAELLFHPSKGGFHARTTPEGESTVRGVLVAGSASGLKSPSESWEEGRRAGARALTILKKGEGLG